MLLVKDQFNYNNSPDGTEWHWGPVSNEDNYDWVNWRNAVYQSGSGPRYALDGEHNGGPSIMSMRIPGSNKYFEFVFTWWQCCNGGGGFTILGIMLILYQVRDFGYVVKSGEQEDVNIEASSDKSLYRRLCYWFEIRVMIL